MKEVTPGSAQLLMKEKDEEEDEDEEDGEIGRRYVWDVDQEKEGRGWVEDEPMTTELRLVEVRRQRELRPEI